MIEAELAHLLAHSRAMEQVCRLAREYPVPEPARTAWEAELAAALRAEEAAR